MSKLLSAGFARMKKDKVFWISVIFMFLLGAFLSVNSFYEKKTYGLAIPLDEFFFGFTLLTGIVSAVFCSLFTGAEYSDGTIRNKLVVGHTRGAIYLSSLILNVVAALLANLAFLAAICAIGIPLLGGLAMGAKAVLLLTLASVMMTLAFAALFTLLGMLIQSKAVVAVISILGAVAMLMAAVTIDQKLREPEFYESIVISDNMTYVNPNDENAQPIPNPSYPSEKARAVYEFLLDLLPTGQAYQISSRSTPHLWQMQLYSLLIAGLATGAGCYFFRRKDLK